MLIENTLLGDVDKVDIAIRRLKSFEPEDGYYVAFGGARTASSFSIWSSVAE